MLIGLIKEKYKILLVFIIFVFSFISIASAFDLVIKLPYKKGESYIITRGYDTNFTHKGKDSFALDFASNGCSIFNKPVLVIASGKVKNVEVGHKPKEIKSYGNQVLVDHGNGIESRYAHLNKVIVKNGDVVEQGDVIGTVGNTGSTGGTACKSYPGTHLHFALYKNEKYQDENGVEREKYVGVRPEPMSGYTEFAVGKSYESDNIKLVQNEDKNETEELVIVAEENQGDYSEQDSDDGFWSGVGNFTDKVAGGIVNSGKNVNGFIINIGEKVGGTIAGTIQKGGEIVAGTGKAVVDVIGPENEKDKRVAGDGDFFESDLQDGVSNSQTEILNKSREESFEEKYNSRLVAKAVFGIADKFSQKISLDAGQKITLSVQYKNIGSQNWNADNIFVNYVHPQTKLFYHPDWVSEKRMSGIDQFVPSGQLGGFTFPIKAPQEEGHYTFFIRPIIFVNGSYEWLGEDLTSWDIMVLKKEELENAKKDKEDEIENINNDEKKEEISSSSETPFDDVENIEKGEVKGVSDETEDPQKKVSGGNYFLGTGGCGGCGGSGGSGIVEIEDSEEEAEIETYLETYPSEITNKIFAEFIFRSSNEQATFQCWIDEGNFVDCESPQQYENLEDGVHKFEIKSILDLQEDLTPAEHTWTIDSVSPEKINDLEAQSARNNIANLSWTLLGNEISKTVIYYNQQESCEVGDFDLENSEKIEINSLSSGTEGMEEKASLEIDYLEKGREYCFAIESEDQVGNVSELSNFASTTIRADVNHLLISEIRFSNPQNSKFIELYNPTDKDIDLYEEYSFQYLGANAKNINKKNFEKGNKIESHGFFLIVHNSWREQNDWNGIEADMDYAGFNLSHLGGAVYLVNSKNKIKIDGEDEIDFGNVVDYISYAEEMIIENSTNSSIERRANYYATAESMIVIPDKYLGNSWDMDDVFDFIVRENSNPQNFQSLKEPRQSQSPQVEIKNPQNDFQYFEGEKVVFEAEVFDIEDGIIDDENIVWEEEELELGKGANIEVENFSLGIHKIVLEVTDSDGEKTVQEINVRIISSDWREPLKIFDLDFDIEVYSMDINNSGETSVVLAINDYCDENDFCDDEVLLYKKYVLGNDEEIIFNTEDEKLSGISNLILKIDSNDVVHIIFQAYDLSISNLNEAVENIYYINSENFSEIKRIIFDANNPQLEIGNDNSLHVSAVGDGGVEIYYTQCAENCLDYINWSYEESYNSELSINNMSMKISDDNSLHFGISTEKIFAPLSSFANQGSQSLLYMIAPSEYELYYIIKDSNGWQKEKIEGIYESYIIPKIGIIDAFPIIAVSDYNLLLLEKAGENWQDKLANLNSEFLVDFGFSFKTDSQGYSHIISVNSDTEENLRWITDFPGGNFQEIIIDSTQGKFSEIYNPQATINKNGKIGIIFEGKYLDDDKYYIYYLEKELD